MSASAQTRRMPRSTASRPKLVPATPEVALLVSTYQRPWHLRRVLTSIAMQEGVRGRMEVVVTDDGSTDETPRIVEQFAGSARFPVSLTTHPHEAFQLARCRNEGVAASRAEYLLFLDGDCVLPPDHVLQHLRHRRVNRVMGGYCYRLDEAASGRFDDEAVRSCKYFDWVCRSERRALRKRDLKARFYQLIRHPAKPRMAGGNLGIWRQDYERVNGYDENFVGWGGEDDDLRLRLRRAGVRVESVLRRTNTYHLWHPPDATAPKKVSHGVNVGYLKRNCRLTRCMNGLVKREPADLALTVVGSTSRPDRAAALLGSYWTTAEDWGAEGNGERPEVEVLFLPGNGRFSGRADCNLLVVLEDSPGAARKARKAHLVVADRPCPDVPAECRFKLNEFERALNALG